MVKQKIKGGAELIKLPTKKEEANNSVPQVKTSEEIA